MKADMKASLEVKETTDVVEPYLAKGDIPANWNSNREAFLRTKVTLDSVDSAQTAINQLNITFKELVENEVRQSTSQR